MHSRLINWIKIHRCTQLATSCAAPVRANDGTTGQQYRTGGENISVSAERKGDRLRFSMEVRAFLFWISVLLVKAVWQNEVSKHFVLMASMQVRRSSARNSSLFRTRDEIPLTICSGEG